MKQKWIIIMAFILVFATLNRLKRRVRLVGLAVSGFRGVRANETEEMEGKAGHFDNLFSLNDPVARCPHFLFLTRGSSMRCIVYFYEKSALDRRIYRCGTDRGLEASPFTVGTSIESGDYPPSSSSTLAHRHERHPTGERETRERGRKNVKDKGSGRKKHSELRRQVYSME
ncbi:uncharacterized protein LOC122400914 isoform X2 [Colletes gigas]|uniref:uncharacterized protein LOC122400914 isoform X2 n=1 Tax=Colletes gigas TaxID=935657 RepID=UPI001C9A78EF|nr:uncharacterized protein LOC122400914 isoform X2 [Colletes gigas]